MIYSTTVQYQIGEELICGNRERWVVIDKWTNPDEMPSPSTPAQIYYRLEYRGPYQGSSQE